MRLGQGLARSPCVSDVTVLEKCDLSGPKCFVRMVHFDQPVLFLMEEFYFFQNEKCLGFPLRRNF